MLKDAIGLVLESLTSLKTFAVILGPTSAEWLEQYCAGLLFGHQGSKMLVKFANMLIHPHDENGEVRKGKNDDHPIYQLM